MFSSLYSIIPFQQLSLMPSINFTPEAQKLPYRFPQHTVLR